MDQVQFEIQVQRLNTISNNLLMSFIPDKKRLFRDQRLNLSFQKIEWDGRLKINESQQFFQLPKRSKIPKRSNIPKPQQIFSPPKNKIQEPQRIYSPSRNFKREQLIEFQNPQPRLRSNKFQLEKKDERKINFRQNNDSRQQIDPKKHINIQQIKKAIKQAKNIIKEQTSGKNIVLFWGFSGVGKSTAVIILNGQKVKAYHNPMPVLVEANPTTQERGVKIGIKHSAGTIYPAVLELNWGGKQTDMVKLWDLPGLGDNRGPTQSLINSYFIHRIFAFNKNIKLIFTIDYLQITRDRRAQGLQKTLYELTEVLGNFQVYYDAVAIMFTKTPQYADQQQTLETLTEILKDVADINTNTNIVKFLTNVINKKIPIILVKIPKLDGKIAASCAIDVTNQYKDLLEKTHFIVTKKLRSVSFPKLNSPAIKKQDISKYILFVEETNSSIDRNIQIICRELQTFIMRACNQGVFEQNIERVQKWLLRCNIMKEFVFRVQQVVSSKNKKGCKERFDLLKTNFEDYAFLCNSNKECEPMTIINDQLVMIAFLNSLLKSVAGASLRWDSQQAVLRHCFSLIDDSIAGVLERSQQETRQRFKSWTIQYFESRFLSTLENQLFYKLWREQYLYFPAFFYHLGKFNKSTNPLSFFNSLKEDCISCKIEGIQKVQNIIEMIGLSQRYLSLTLPNDFISNSIKPSLQRKGRELIMRATDQDNLTQKQVEQAIRKLNANNHLQASKDVKKISSQKDKNVEQNKNFKNNQLQTQASLKAENARLVNQIKIMQMKHKQEIFHLKATNKTAEDQIKTLKRNDERSRQEICDLERSKCCFCRKK